MSKSLHRFAAFALVLSFILAIPAAAASTSTTVYFQDYPHWQDKVFSPEQTGTLHASFYSNYARTTLYFEYSQDNADTINEYRFLGYSHYGKAYTGVDVTHVPNGSTEYWDVYSVTTSLPNPIYDMESDNLDGKDEEAEAIAGADIDGDTVYTMTAQWTDFRNGSAGCSGEWRAKSELSQPSIMDYNVISGQYADLIQLEHGPTKGYA